MQRVVPRLPQRRPAHRESVGKLREQPQPLRDGGAARVAGKRLAEPASRRERRIDSRCQQLPVGRVVEIEAALGESLQRSGVVADEVVRLEPRAAVADLRHFDGRSTHHLALNAHGPLVDARGLSAVRMIDLRAHAGGTSS